MNLNTTIQFKGLGKDDKVVVDREEIQGVVRAEKVTVILLKGGNRVNVGVTLDEVLGELDNVESTKRKKQLKTLNADPS